MLSGNFVKPNPDNCKEIALSMRACSMAADARDNLPDSCFFFLLSRSLKIILHNGSCLLCRSGALRGFEGSIIAY
jgi:hypothetical protein